jgi:hypothetical protein
MKKASKNAGSPGAAASGIPGVPVVVDRATFQAELGRLRVREKAHTREGDAISAARRRLPMAEADASLPLTGPHGPLTLLEAFEGRRQLIAYYFMWNPGRPAAEQELPPGRRRPSRRGTEPGGGQDPADRPLPRPVPQADQLALDAPVSPARVLPRQLLHQCPHLGRDRRSPRRPRISPFLPHQAPVPGQQGARRHHPVHPGSSLARAAITARSAQSGLGRAT